MLVKIYDMELTQCFKANVQMYMLILNRKKPNLCYRLKARKKKGVTP